MRVLFTCTSTIFGLGSFLPLTPIARTMADVGHEVAFATPTSVRGNIEAAGFRWIRAGAEDDDPEMTALRARQLTLHGSARRQFTFEEIFGGVLPRRIVPDVLALAGTWRPDLFVRDCTEYGGMIAAELLDIPHAKVEVHAAGFLPQATAMLYEPLQRLRATFGLPERSIQDLMNQYLVLTPFPASLNMVDDPIPPTAHNFRGLPADDPNALLPGWITGLGTRPLVYVSLGTVFSGDRGLEIFSKLLAGLRDVDAEIVLTVGNDLEPAAFGPQPEHIHMERYLPLRALLARCSLALFHGGSGTLGHVIANGLPMVILPLGADQFDNAARCAELGASRTLDPDQLTPEHIRDVILDVLHTPSYRQAAERLRDEFDAMPGPEFAVELLERLVKDKAPIIASR